MFRSFKIPLGVCVTAVAMTLPSLSFAADKDAASSVHEANVIPLLNQQLAKINPQLKAISSKASGLPGINRLEMSDGQYVYVDQSLTNLFVGQHFRIDKNGNLINVVEQEKAPERAAKLASLDAHSMITFSPADGTPTKETIYVFTDVDCGYCQKFHLEIPALNKAGIEIKYLGFPRAGITSRSHKKLVTAWCDKDQNGTLTRLKNNEHVKISLCDDNPIGDQLFLGKSMGVRGTPAIVTAQGNMLPGYFPAAELIAKLDSFH